MPNSEENGHTAAKWSGRFVESLDARVLRYTASVGFDQRLAAFDIAGSLAHARMLAGCGVISKQDLADIERGMAAIGDEIRSGRFEWALEAPARRRRPEVVREGNLDVGRAARRDPRSLRGGPQGTRPPRDRSDAPPGPRFLSGLVETA